MAASCRWQDRECQVLVLVQAQVQVDLVAKVDPVDRRVAFSRAITAVEVEVVDEVDAEGEEEGGDSHNYNKAGRA